jgi:hypothetical protein
MKTLAYYPIHYGSEYLPYSIQSIRDHVDKILIIYSEKPTYGHTSNLQNPDSKEDIIRICEEYGCEFMNITALHIGQENEHRKIGIDYARAEGYDMLVACDYDEVWKDLDIALEIASKGKAFQYGIRGECWYHFWKSFNEVNTDGFSPIRIFNLKKQKGEDLIVAGTVYHFGYAISRELMDYKISVHGHKTEFGNWVDTKWKTYERGRTRYLHPATNAYWVETEDFDKTTLPEFMRDHPMYES